MKTLFAFLLINFSLLLSCNRPQLTPLQKKEPTSEIPDKRHFPVNNEISPCENFYEHVCSLVNASFKLRDDRSLHTFAFSDSSERILEFKKKFLAELVSQKRLKTEADQNSENYSIGTQLLRKEQRNSIRTIYQACMNSPARQKEENDLVSKVMTQLKGVDSLDQFQEFLSSKVISEEYSFLNTDNITNQKRPDWDDLYLISDLQSLPERSFYDKPEVLADLENLITNFFETVNPKDAKRRAQRLLDFEKRFSKTYPLPAEFRDIINRNTETPRKKMVSQYPALKLDLLFKRLPTQTAVRNIVADSFAFLNRELQSGDLEVLKDVYAFQALSDELDDAFPKYFEKKFDFSRKHLGGPQVRPAREERCTRLVMSSFGRELDHLLVDEMFPDFDRSKVIRLAQRVRAAIVAGIMKNRWLSDSAREKALLKIKTARLHLIRPSKYDDWDFNPKMDFSDSAPISNMKRLSHALNIKMFKELSAPRNRNRWSMSPLTVNAYYSAADNKFVLPIGILQYPFYDGSLTAESNLAAMGMVMAHELGHAIDDKGSLYDEQGRLVKWMKEKDLENFKSRGQRLVHHFDKAKHNGRLTLGENVADLVGLTFAHQAAFAPNPEDADLEAQRMFYTQYGRLWCTVARPGYLEMLLKVDTHAQAVARVNEQVRHQEYFQKAFSCPSGSPMTLAPEDRVSIW